MEEKFMAEKSFPLNIKTNSIVKLFFLILFIASLAISNTITIFQSSFRNTRKLQENKNYSEIIVIIDNSNNDPFINEDFFPKPYIEYLSENEILMKWNETVENCENMF